MEREVSSEHIERFDYEEGYRNAFLFRLKELDVKNVYEPCSDTGKQDAAFVNLMSATHNALKEKIKARKIATSYELEKLVADSDIFTAKFQKDEQFSPEVEAAWREYKRNYLIDLILSESSRTRRLPGLKQFGKSIAKLLVYSLATAAAVAGGTHVVYEYFIKPDIKREVRDELMNNQTCLSGDDINRICDTVEERYPFFKAMKKQGEQKKKE